MNEDQFWNIIEHTNPGSSTLEEQRKKLLNLLLLFSDQPLLEFQTQYYDFRSKAYRWEVWNAVWLIDGGGAILSPTSAIA